MRGRLDYRPHLDGLRAVAVVPVILFHLGFPYTPGGFVGVDVFFVLSGYLITRQIALDLREGNFSLLAFYDRRIRRLFPALFAMLFVSTVAAIVILLPDDLLAFGQTLIAVSFSVGNFHFWSASGYFAPAAESIPLLHTWSLAVEEQFYLLFPPLLMLLWRYSHARMTICVAILAVASLAVSIWSSGAAPQAAFYLLPSRAWELLLGSLLALAPLRAPSPGGPRNMAALAGLAAIAIAVATYHEGMIFPGVAAVLPCIGCALVIWAGETSGTHSGDAREQSFALRLLALPPLVFLGLISYSLYLWHWPLIVFTQHISPQPLNIWQSAMLVLAIFAISFASWKLIEQPLRRGDRLWTTTSLRLRYGATLVGGFALVGLTLELGKGLPWLQPRAVLALLDDARDQSPERKRCHIRRYDQGRRTIGDTCFFGDPAGRRIIVLGDSHGTELSFALSEVAIERSLHVRQITASSCPPALDYSTESRPHCKHHMERIMEGLATLPSSTILMAAVYFRLASAANPTREQFWKGLEKTVSSLRSSGHNVILLGGWPPHLLSPLPLALAREIKRGHAIENYVFPIDQALGREIEHRLTAIASQYGAEFLPLLETVCGSSIVCRGAAEGEAIYFDDGHITVASARRIVRNEILPLLERGSGTASASPAGTTR